MPFARISLHRGKSAEYLQALSQGLHDALVDSFEVPMADFPRCNEIRANGITVYS